MGDRISGTVNYELKKPTEGRELWVEVRATQRISQPKPMRVRRDDRWTTEIRRSTHINTLFKERLELDNYHLYDQGSYEFEIQLPPRLPETAPNSDLAKAAEVVQAVFSGIPVERGAVQWAIEAKLHIPWSFGVSDKKSIEVREQLSSRPASFCGECGEAREARHKFCPFCGTQF